MLAIGVDAGGTATRAVVTTLDGRCVGYGVAGRGNPVSAGRPSAVGAVLEAVGAATVSAGRALSEVSVIAAAVAGQPASGAGAESLQAELSAAGFTGRVVFESDLLATYFSATASGNGYAVVSGTGACAIRVAEGRIEATADGLGWLLGDRGSGFWIGQRVAEAAIRDLDGVGRMTALTRAVLDHLGIDPQPRPGAERSPELEELVSALYALPPIELASLAPLAFRCVEDPVAAGILRRAGERLAESLLAVLTEPGPLVVGGGVLFRSGPVRDAFTGRLGGSADRLDVIPVEDGVVGAGLLALRAGGLPPTREALARLTETLALVRRSSVHGAPL
ncbi:N-acetylglucosamine kinase [Microbacterium sp. CIAB417]|uniref:N-acetylglucosamine kinase n=1 Tax=Microbacterium sp. CIAB417 TaxID=2860287 RepID=UPI001FAD648A|nr:BadF/BadG/BcrA/BcrD ATPase family protein [Microbacterium sp. CIAB417]